MTSVTLYSHQKTDSNRVLTSSSNSDVMTVAHRQSDRTLKLLVLRYESIHIHTPSSLFSLVLPSSLILDFFDRSNAPSEPLLVLITFQRLSRASRSFFRARVPRLALRLRGNSTPRDPRKRGKEGEKRKTKSRRDDVSIYGFIRSIGRSRRFFSSHSRRRCVDSIKLSGDCITRELAAFCLRKIIASTTICVCVCV